ncbi:MAG TPA: His/Gly/Thr/Pro-type tRNA ligase C-terminal domain-containing protein [Methanocorpusculum sp.]|nr:His/Gly/Thr/Pro-type tRNA ligase C-terminal domain-containing protein [Methanocorpusculum sp.]
MGTPYCITVDYDTKDDTSVTLRDRDSMKQIRGPSADVLKALPGLLKGRLPFDQSSL